MASTLKPLAPLPLPTEPLVDPRTGVVNTNWFLWLKSLGEHTREIEKRLDTIGA